MRCSYTYCFREAATRCSRCHRVYCTRHCGDRVLASGDRVPECDSCDPALKPLLADHEQRLTTLRDILAVMLFLLVVALGIAIDITAKGTGLVALWVFLGAFILVMAPRQR